MRIGKKTLFVVTGLGSSSVGAGIVSLARGLSAASGEDPEDSISEPSSLDTPVGTAEETRTAASVQPQPRRASSSSIVRREIKPMSNKIADWSRARNYQPLKQGYGGGDSAVSNIESFDLSGAQKFTEVKNKQILRGFFGPVISGDYSDTRSSLRIRFQKKKYDSEKKGLGTFSGFWSFVHNNRGFMTFNVAETVQGTNHLKLTGGFYLLERQDVTSKGKIKYYKEQDGDDKIINAENFKHYFPRPYWGTQKGEFDKYYYSNGRFGTENNLKNICGVDDCKGTPRTSTVVGAGEWAGDSGSEEHCSQYKYLWCDNVYEWSSDHTNVAALQGYDYIYGNDELNLKDALYSFIKGYWRSAFYIKPNIFKS